MHKNSAIPVALLSPMPLSFTKKKGTPSKLHQTPSSTLKPPSRKFMRRSFTPIGLNYAESPVLTPIEKSSILESSRDFLDGSLTPKNTSTCNLFVNSANRNNCLTPQQFVAKKTEMNKTFTIRGNRATKKKIDCDDRASIRRVLHWPVSPLAATVTPSKSPKTASHAFSPVELGVRPPTPMPEFDDELVSSPEPTFVMNILDRTMSIATILMEIGMEKYQEKFEFEEIDLFVFSKLDRADLVDLGVDVADRPTFVRAIDSYRDLFGNVDHSNC